MGEVMHKEDFEHFPSVGNLLTTVLVVAFVLDRLTDYIKSFF